MLRYIGKKQLEAYMLERNLKEFQFDPCIVLSGSALIQITFNKLWCSSDTDIFCTKSAYIEVERMLDEGGYHMAEVLRPGSYSSTIDLTTDSENEVENAPASRVPFDLYPAINRTVFKWVLPKTETTPSYHIDVIVAAAEISRASDLLATFDIEACMSSWDGLFFRWHDPTLLFQNQTRLTRQVQALLVGFLQGWKHRQNFPDECLTGRDFLRSRTWIEAARAALAEAADFYAQEHLPHILASLLDYASRRHFLFFHRQLARIVKYSRRGFHVIDFTDNLHFWVVCAGMMHIAALPW
jgi:hypothetical protein